jgi:hypothetical protein
VNEYYYLEKWNKMSIDEKIIRGCCVCRTAILPDNSVVTEKEARDKGYVISHGIHSKACLLEYITDVYTNQSYQKLPDYCQKR